MSSVGRPLTSAATRPRDTAPAAGARGGEDSRAAGPERAGRAGPPEVALIVCTRNRAEHLPQTLAALAAIRSRHPWELVLVDSGSSDDTPELLARFAASAPRAPEVAGAPGAIVVVREPRPGLGRAHNTGVRSTRAPVLCFTDDDCYPAPDFIDRWAEVFDDPTVGYAGGTIELYDPADHPITIKPEQAADRRLPFAYVEPGCIHGANMAFRRAPLVAAGGFDEALGPGGVFNCEDVDMAARVAARGAAGGYFPKPTVWHHHRRRAGPDVDALERSYAHGIGAYRMSLLLRRTTLKHGAWAWANTLREAMRYAGNPGHFPRIARELLGAAHYVAHRVARAVAPRRG